ncbi:WD-REPEATS-REGION domain-containing protein [Mycena kentingensis (nom. inval.)]|nr:WD-REPEATS-REGION domain-containing protein [Mycena kentingensis (nom. inval.)]
MHSFKQYKLQGHHGSILSLNLRSDGKQLASGGDDGVKIWDLATQSKIPAPAWSELRGPTTKVLWIKREDDDEALLLFGTGHGFIGCWREATATALDWANWQSAAGTGDTFPASGTKNAQGAWPPRRVIGQLGPIARVCRMQRCSRALVRAQLYVKNPGTALSPAGRGQESWAGRVEGTALEPLEASSRRPVWANRRSSPTTGCQPAAEGCGGAVWG